MEASVIRVERVRRDITQRRMAELAGVNSSALSGIERRKITATRENQQKIVKVLGGSEADFFDSKTGLAI